MQLSKPAGLLQDPPTQTPLDLTITKSRTATCLQHQECTSSTHTDTPVYMHMQYMTSRAAVVLLRDSQGLLVARQQTGPIPSYTLSTTTNLSDSVLAAIRGWEKGGEGDGKGETGAWGGGIPVEQGDAAGKGEKVHHQPLSSFDSWQL